MRLNPDDLINERYKVIQELGRGGFGITYTAEDTWRSPLIVVLKQISLTTIDNSSESARDSSYINKLEAEAKVLRELEYPCIPKFFASFVTDNYYYIVQEYIAGHDLTQEILPGEPIDEFKTVDLLQKVSAILHFVHQNNIIHRDIKPANIIRRDRDSELFLIDFGAVKEIATEHNNAEGITLTRIIQSRGYSPIEQLSGHPRLNSDIYALGMMIMQAVTGFSVNAICSSDTAPYRDSQGNYIWQEYAPQISPKLKKVISKMVERNFSDRYQTVTEVLSALETMKVSPGNKTKHNSLKGFFSQQQKLIRLLALGITVCCLLILFQANPFYRSNICNNLDDNISCGEEILDPLSKGSIRARAAQEYENKEYQLAAADYQLSWQKERRDAESLIYLNNSLLAASQLDYYTVAVAVPLSSDEKISIQNSKLAQNFLRGVAQAQTEINLSLSRKNAIFKLLPEQDVLEPKNISGNSDRGLRVVIVDDGNNLEQAKTTAASIAETSELLGVVGNYASEMTLGTVDIYEQNNLAQVSFGTTTKRLSTNHRRNFFRVVYTNAEEAETVVKYIQSINAEKQVAGFYNPSSPFSNYFWIEISDLLKQLGIPADKTFNIADENFNAQLALKEADNLGVNVYILLPDGQVTNALSNAIEVIKADNGKSFIIGGNSIVRPEVTKLNVAPTTNLAASIFWHPLSPQNSQFLQQSQQLWDANINNGTAVAYDAAISLIEAIKLQSKPSRKGTIAELANPQFLIQSGATGSIKFNSPQNGDRQNFYPTLVRLAQCQDENRFIPLSLDEIEVEKLACSTNK